MKREGKDKNKRENRVIVTDVIGTPFDDVFRTLLERCQKLIIPVINEVFGTGYTMDEETVLLSDVHYIVESDGKSIKRVTDSTIKIRDRLYHIECESNSKTGMEIRMIEYDFHIALSGKEKQGGTEVLRFPESAVLLLRHNSKSPDMLKVKLIMPDGSSAHYTVPVVKVQKYTKEEIFDKNLLFFIPYYVLRFEQRLTEKQGMDSIEKEFLEDYADIYNRLKGLQEKQIIDYNYLHDLISLTTRLIEVVSKNNPNIMKEVSVMGGGKVLEMESERIYNRGVSEGMAQGISRGISGSIIEFLSEYGEVPESLKDRISNENDITVLKAWNKLLARVSSVEEFMEKM